MARVALISTDFTIYALGTRALSAYLKQRGHQVVVIFLPGWENPHGIVGARVRKEESYSRALLDAVAREVSGCQVIGISSTALTRERVLALLPVLKPLGVPIVWGGIFATTNPELCLQHVDIACVGEGEGALADLVERVASGQPYDDVPNLHVRRDGTIARNAVRPLIPDLDALPFSDYDLVSQRIGIGDRLRPLDERDLFGGWLLVHGTRGCPFACTYCSNHFLHQLYGTRKVRHRSVDSVVAELAVLRSRVPSAQRVWFTDDDFFARSQRDLERFAVEYPARVGLPFLCYTSPNTLREDKLQLALRAGLKKVLVGIQSGSERLNRDVYQRPVRRQRVLQAAALLHQYRAYMQPPTYQMIICSPFEEETDVLQNIELLRALPRRYFLEVCGLNLFPGTRLEEQARQAGLLTADNSRSFNTHYMDLVDRLRGMATNRYLNSVLHWMEGTTTTWRHGMVPSFLLGPLLQRRVIDFNQRHGLPADLLNRASAARVRAGEHLFLVLKEMYTASPPAVQRLLRRWSYGKNLPQTP